jgi:hypothetical protein
MCSCDHRATAVFESRKEVLLPRQLAEGNHVIRSGVPHPGHLSEHEAEVANTPMHDGVTLTFLQAWKGDLEMNLDSAA